MGSQYGPKAGGGCVCVGKGKGSLLANPSPGLGFSFSFFFSRARGPLAGVTGSSSRQCAVMPQPSASVCF